MARRMGGVVEDVAEAGGKLVLPADAKQSSGGR
jgi:hypothetical protein